MDFISGTPERSSNTCMIDKKTGFQHFERQFLVVVSFSRLCPDWEQETVQVSDSRMSAPIVLVWVLRWTTPPAPKKVLACMCRFPARLELCCSRSMIFRKKNRHPMMGNKSPSQECLKALIYGTGIYLSPVHAWLLVAHTSLWTGGKISAELEPRNRERFLHFDDPSSFYKRWMRVVLNLFLADVPLVEVPLDLEWGSQASNGMCSDFKMRNKRGSVWHYRWLQTRPERCQLHLLDQTDFILVAGSNFCLNSTRSLPGYHQLASCYLLPPYAISDRQGLSSLSIEPIPSL